MLNINGVDLEFDMFDVETSKAYESAFEVLNKLVEGLKKETVMSTVFEESCAAIKTVFDTLFGGGTGIEVCGERDNYRTCNEALQALVDEAVKQRAELDEMQKAATTKYQGNRAQRRTK